MLVPWKKSYEQPRQLIKKQRHYFSDKGPPGQSYGFSSIHVWMWDLDHKEGWVIKNWCFWTVVLEKTLEIPLDSKEIKPVNPKGDQSWIFIARTDTEAEAPRLWPPDAKSQVFTKILMLGNNKSRRRRERQKTRLLDGITDSMDMSLSKLWKLVIQGSLVCCSPWRRRVDRIKRLNCEFVCVGCVRKGLRNWHLN